MILKIPTANKKYLTADEIRTHNEWCARLAQLVLAGAVLENHTQKVVKDPRRSHTEMEVAMIDEVPEPYAEPPDVRCQKCSNNQIDKFNIVYYERRYRPIRGFTQKGEVRVSDDSDSDSIGSNDSIEAARALAGEWLECGGCGHEQRFEFTVDW